MPSRALHLWLLATYASIQQMFNLLNGGRFSFFACLPVQSPRTHIRGVFWSTRRFQREFARPRYRIRNFYTSAESKPQYLLESLEHVDKTVYTLIQREQQNKKLLLNFVRSANYTSRSVLSALGSVLQNPNSEGYLGARYFPGTQYLDEVEDLCQMRAPKAFGLDDAIWGVNVQSHSRELANLQAYSAVLAPHDRLLALELPRGSYIAKYFTAVTCKQGHLSPQINYNAIEDLASSFLPRVISTGSVSSSQLIDYGAMSAIGRKVGAIVMADITEISGLIAAGLVPSPFEHSDIVLSGTQGSSRGPCGAIVFSRKALPVKRVDNKGLEEIFNLGSAIEASIFPRHQGGPHNHTIMAVAVAMQEIQTESFKKYQTSVLANATALADRLLGLGCDVSGNGTQNHRLAIRTGDIDANSAKEVLDMIGIACTAVTTTSELHFGSYAMTTRGLLPDDFGRVADIICRALAIAQEFGRIKNTEGTAESDELFLADRETFQREIYKSCGSNILEMQQEVKEWMCTFGVPWQ